jgi:hypothetical protein
VPRLHAALPLIGFFAPAALSLIMRNDCRRPLWVMPVGGTLRPGQGALA